MSTVQKIFSDPSVVAVISLVGTWLVAHRVGLVKVLTRWVQVLEGGNISIQQVVDAAEKVDPELVDNLKGKIAALEAKAQADAKELETKVQAAAAAQLQEFINKLQSVPLPVPDQPEAAVPADPASPPAGA